VRAHLTLTLLSPERRLLNQVQVDAVILTGSEGQIQILPGHEPLVGTLETGLFSYQINPETHKEGGGIGVISSGFFEVKDNQVILIAETLELKGEIDSSRALSAQQKAEKMLREAALSESDFKKYQLKLQRALIRQQVGSEGPSSSV
jgi:F-type H+-transporting ATPase subunit epsilon